MAAPTMFDHEYPCTEQIPRIMRVNITSQNGRALTTINGETFGNPLTDNRPVDDGYRYHDVFHIAHATHLGCSPTLRGPLRKKRRSSPRVHEAQDGRRAIVIEEGLTALVFSYAERHSLRHGMVPSPWHRPQTRTRSSRRSSPRTPDSGQNAPRKRSPTWSTNSKRPARS